MTIAGGGGGAMTGAGGGGSVIQAPSKGGGAMTAPGWGNACTRDGEEAASDNISSSKTKTY